MDFDGEHIEPLEYSDLTNWTLSRPLRVGVVAPAPPYMFEYDTPMQ
jgi:hypothetical protein